METTQVYPPCPKGASFTYRLQGLFYSDLLKKLDTICDFIDRMMLQRSKNGNKNILGHCFHGISRSPTAVIAYLMRKDRKDLATVLSQVKVKRPLVKPSANFTNLGAIGLSDMGGRGKNNPQERICRLA